MYYMLVNLISFKNNGNMNKSHVDPNSSLLVALKDSVKGNHQNGKKNTLSGTFNHPLLVKEMF